MFKKHESTTEKLTRIAEAGDPAEKAEETLAPVSDAEAAREAIAEAGKMKRRRFGRDPKEDKGPGRFETWIYNFYRRHMHNFLGIAFVTAMFAVFLTETMAHGIVGGLHFVFATPLVYLVNVLIIFATISLALLFRRRLFVYTLISVFWIFLGFANAMILRTRMTPLNTFDLAEAKDGLALLTTYFSTKQIIEGGLGIAAVILFIVFLFLKMPKEQEERNSLKAVATTVCVWIIMLGCLWGGIRVGVMDTFFPNLPYGFRDNGYYYGFLATWLDKGVDKPKDYTPERMTAIFTDEERNTVVPGRLEAEDPALKDIPNKATEEYPNILIVQLESFMDPTDVKGLEYSKDPMPNFRALEKTCPSGRLWVPSMGAGTANTEYEVLTGMSVKFYGAGETPYKTTLLDQTCESLPYDLMEFGYTSHAIHNHRGAFYGRNKVYPNMGFSTFTCLEYMNGITKTPKNWAKDAVLPAQIFDALDSTKGKDFVFTVSVQGHGKYPTEQMLQEPAITVVKKDDDVSDEIRWQWEYYANQLYEMDEFVGELCEDVSKYDEPTVVIFYGDHMPAIDNISEDTLKKGRNIFQTDYIVYSNFDLDMPDEDLYSYQLSADLMDVLGMHNGTMFTFHQTHRDSKTYLDDMQALQYDLLFGKQYIYDGETPYQPVAMRMGIHEIRVTDIVQVGDKWYIQGENFTEYSKINLDGEILKTTYLNPTLLELKEDVDPEAVPRMRVSQVEKSNEILSTSE